MVPGVACSNWSAPSDWYTIHAYPDTQNSDQTPILGYSNSITLCRTALTRTSEMCQNVRKRCNMCTKACSNWSIYNWDAYLSKWFIPLVGINKHHIFSFHKDNPGVVLMKQTPDDEGLEMNLLEK